MRVLLLTHGGWGTDLLRGVKMILGNIDFVDEVPLKPEYTLQEYLQLVEKASETMEQNSIILTDLFGGTPSNVSAVIAKKKNIKVYSGLNAAMLLEVCSEIQFSGSIDYEQVFSAGKNACIDILAEIEKRKKEDK